jgi:hypothetical protein
MWKVSDLFAMFKPTLSFILVVFGVMLVDRDPDERALICGYIPQALASKAQRTHEPVENY